ncbi:hypothetical protein [Pontibacter chitinilyticus]
MKKGFAARNSSTTAVRLRIAPAQLTTSNKAPQLIGFLCLFIWKSIVLV